MRPNLPIALGAGIISAIVFASATTGPAAMRLALLALTTLPIALAGYAYNARTAILAASVGTLVLGVLTNMTVGAIFAATLAFPAAFLVYLALLHRDNEAGSTQWYPIGRILVATALIAATVVAFGLAASGSDADKLQAMVRASIETMIKAGFTGFPGGGALSEADLSRAADIMLQLLPGVSASFWMSFILLCQWGAARVALASGQLTRPWPDLAAFQVPQGTPALFGLAIACAMFLDGMPQLMALGFAGALYVVYVLLGLAVIHHVTRGASWRGGALAAVYIGLFVLNSGGSLLLALLGLTESLLSLRRLPNEPNSNDQTTPKA